MKLLLLLAWRHLTFRPGKTFASILGIGVGIATVITVLTLDHNTILTRAAGVERTEPATDLVLQPLANVNRDFVDVVAELRNSDYLLGVTAYAQKTFAFRQGEKTIASVSLMAIEEGASRDHGAYVVEEGDDLDWAADEPQLLVTRSFATQYELGVGDVVGLAERDKRRAVSYECKDGELVKRAPKRNARKQRPVAGGETHPFRIVGILAPTQLGFARTRVLTTFTAGRDVIGEDMNPLFWANFDRAKIDYHGLESDLRGSFLVVEPERAPSSEAPEEVAFRSGVRFCGFLALFLGLYIIFNTMSMSLVERVRQIGLLRALGVTRRQLLVLFVVEGALLAVAGAALSLGIAWWLVDFLASHGISTLGYDPRLTVTVWPWDTIVLVLIAGIVFCLLGVLYPFLRASRLSVIDALRRGVIELSRDPFSGIRRTLLVGVLGLVPVAWIVGAPTNTFVSAALYEVILSVLGVVGGIFILLLVFPRVLPDLAARIVGLFGRGAAVVLAGKTIRSSQHRVFGSVSGLMLVFAAVFLIVSVLESLKSETRVFGNDALEGRIFARIDADGAANVAELRSSDKDFLPLVGLGAEVLSPFIVRGIDGHALLTGSLAERDAAQYAFRTDRAVILSTRCADDFGYEVDDWVTLNTRSDGAVDFRVLAITDEYGFAPDDRVFAAMSTANLKRYFCETALGMPGWYVIDARGGPLAPALTDTQALADVEQRMEAALGADTVLELRTGRDIADSYLADLDSDFQIFYAILVLTIILAAVGILNAMVIAVMERRREIGLLRSVGLTAGQVAKMLLTESGAFGVLGGLFGLILGVPLAVLTTRALTLESHLDLSFELAPSAVIGVIAGAVFISVLAVVLPVIRANGMKLSSVMRYE